MNTEEIRRLVDKYNALAPARRRWYREAQTRKDFIDPLFAALGWDIHGVERDEVDVEEHTPAGFPDYTLKLEGVARFYVEAKPLEDDLYNQEYAKKAITYAYNKGVTWAVLCNFTRVQVFNAEWETTDLTKARVLDVEMQDYAKARSDIVLLSREAVVKRRLEEVAQRYGGMRARLPVERSLYRQMRTWRAELFNVIARFRPELSLEQVDEVIERLFNRLIFIRNCEDRGVEEPVLRGALHRWQERGRRSGLTEDVVSIFAQFDSTFDSDLFRPHLTEHLLKEAGTQLEDVLGEMVSGLYQPPRSLAAYDFAVIDVDVLGAVYEQYLGHVAKVVKERAKAREGQLELGLEVERIAVEEKRERRKEQGIYYTPKWVVDYIVRQTVGRYLEERAHHEILNMKILDPACGSGSFLIRAFDALLDYHARVKGKTTAQLDQYERLRILTANIYGVDLDQRAVGFACLNLLLRAVAKRELLPSLEKNVVRGNSLVSGTEEELRSFFGNTWQEKASLDWEENFSEVISGGGFDVVIGNPPYVRIQSVAREEADYYRSSFASAHGSFDLYVLFIERALDLLKDGGRLGFITSGKFLKSKYGERICRLLRERATVDTMLDLSLHADVFGDSTSYPVILIAMKGHAKTRLTYTLVPDTAQVLSAQTISELEQESGIEAAQEALTKRVWPPPTGRRKVLMEKLESVSESLSEVCEKIFVGVQTSADDVYILDRLRAAENGKIFVHSRVKDRHYELEGKLLKPLLSGEDISRYARPTPKRVLLFPYTVKGRTARLLSQDAFEKMYRSTWDYLTENKERLENREDGKMKHEEWYSFVYPKNLGIHEFPKLAVPRLVYRLEAVYDEVGEFYLDNVDVNGILEPKDPWYLLALLNSKLLDFYFRQVSAPFRGGYRSANRQFIESLPIKRIEIRGELSKRDRLEALARTMVDLQSRVRKKGDIEDSEREELGRRSERMDKEIDELVYALYGLTKAERDLVEQEVRR